MLPTEPKKRWIKFYMWTILAVFVLIARPPVSFACDYKENNPSQADVGIVIYGTSWCPYCIGAKQFFDELSINYSNCDVEQSPLAKMKFEELEGNGVPLIMVGDVRINGFNTEAIEQALKQINFDLNT